MRNTSKKDILSAVNTTSITDNNDDGVENGNESLSLNSAADFKEKSQHSYKPQNEVNKNEDALKSEVEYYKAQLDYQIQVNNELKRLLVASMGDDLQLHLEGLSQDKARLAQNILSYSRELSQEHENTQKLAIDSDVWRSKFLACRSLGSSIHYVTQFGKCEAAVDLSVIEGGFGFEFLQENLINVAFCDLQPEFETLNSKSLDSCFLKIFRVAQYLIEYLLHSQQYLEEKLAAVSEKLATEENEVKRLTKKLFAAKNQWKAAVDSTVKEGNARKCEFCKKRFINENYLAGHLKRRHANYHDATKTKCETGSWNTGIITQNVAESKNENNEDRMSQLLTGLESLKCEISNLKNHTVSLKGWQFEHSPTTTTPREISKLEQTMNERIKALEEIEKRMLFHLDEYKVSSRNGRSWRKITASGSKSPEFQLSEDCAMMLSPTKLKEAVSVPGKYLEPKPRTSRNKDRCGEKGKGLQKSTPVEETSDTDSGSLLHTQEEVNQDIELVAQTELGWEYSENSRTPPAQQTAAEKTENFHEESKSQVPFGRPQVGLLESEGTVEEKRIEEISVQNEETKDLLQESNEHKQPERPPRKRSLELLARNKTHPPSSEPESRTGSIGRPSSMESNTTVWNVSNEEDFPDIGESVEVRELRPRFHSIEADDVSVESL